MGAPGGAPLSLPFTGPKPGEEPNQFGSLNQTLGAIPPGQSSFGPVAPPMAPGMAPGMVTPPSLPPDAMQSGQDPMSALAAMMLPGFMQLIQGMPPAEQEPVPPEASGGGWREGLAGLIKGAAGGIMGQPTRGSDYLEGRQAQRAGMGEKRLEAEERNRLRREQSSGTKREMAQRGIEKKSEHEAAMALAGTKNQSAIDRQNLANASDEQIAQWVEEGKVNKAALDREHEARLASQTDKRLRDFNEDNSKDKETSFEKWRGQIDASVLYKIGDVVQKVRERLQSQIGGGAGKGLSTTGVPHFTSNGQTIEGSEAIRRYVRQKLNGVQGIPPEVRDEFVNSQLELLEKTLRPFAGK